jgi:hypothetical protein
MGKADERTNGEEIDIFHLKSRNAFYAEKKSLKALLLGKQGTMP